MEWVETTGKSVEEALEQALDQLGVHDDDAEYEVLVEPKTGFLGRFGGTEARIRARVKPLSREKPGERRRGRKPRRSGSSGEGGAGSSGRRSSRSRDDGANAAPPDREPPTTNGATTGAGPGSEQTRGGSTTSRRRRGGRGRGSGEGAGREPASDAKTENRGPGRPADERGEAMENGSESSIEDQMAAAQDFTRGLVEAFGADATVTARLDDEILLVEVEGENLGLLVGPRGATLHAIEELVRTVVQRQTDGHGMRIHVDVAGYRAKRREALAAFTRQLVEKVLESGREQVLDPMPPPDRKVVHDTVGEFDGVETSSEGEEPRRRVVIRTA